MSAAPGASGYSSGAGYQNALTMYGGTRTENGVTYSINNPGAGAIYSPQAAAANAAAAKAASSSASASVPSTGGGAVAPATSVARTPTPQETANTKYMSHGRRLHRKWQTLSTCRNWMRRWQKIRVTGMRIS